MKPTKTVLLAVTFVALGFAAKVVPWWALAHIVGEGSIAIPAAGAVLAAGLTWLGLRRFPELRLAGVDFLPARLGRDTAWTLGGFLFGVVLQAAVVGVSIWRAALTLQWQSPAPATLALSLGIGLAFAATNATWEEYTLRGFPLSALGRAFGSNSGVWATAALFSFLHLMNPKWSASMLAETLFAGVLLGYAVLTGRSILFAIGLHTGWNLTESFFQSTRWWVSSGQIATSAELVLTGLGAVLLFGFASSKGRGIEAKVTSDPLVSSVSQVK